VPAAEVFLRPLERLAIFDADPVPRLAFLPSPVAVPQLAVHPGSGSERKNWPEGRWKELLLCLLNQTDVHLLLIAGEAEADRVARLAANLPSSRAQWALNLPLPELARRLAACRGFVGHDSGISHLAAAVGRPVLALWGETSETVWKPAGGHVRILRGGTALAGISVEQALDAVRDLLS
jgi:heptosyltransferase III